MLTVGSLFSGIGGFDLGFARAGMRTVWFCEQDPFCRRVLARHWPGVPCHPDVRALVADTERGRLVGAGDDEREHAEARRGITTEGKRVAGEGDGQRPVPVPVPYVDVLCGGFPCQDISLAGRGAGIEGSRSGLWGEFARLIGELRPRYVVVENVPAITSRGLDRVLADLAACGFDAEWDHLPASAFGAPHRRDRFWLVAYPNGEGEHDGSVDAEVGGASQPASDTEGDGRRSGWPGGSAPGGEGEREPVGPLQDVADASRDGAGQPAPAGTVGERAGAGGEPSGAGDVPDAEVERLEGTRLRGRPALDGAAMGNSNAVGWDGWSGQLGEGWRGEPASAGEREPQSRMGLLADGLPARLAGPWDREPDIPRVATGVDERVAKLRALGNALVPQIAEWIGTRIVEYEDMRIAA